MILRLKKSPCLYVLLLHKREADCCITTNIGSYDTNIGYFSLCYNTAVGIPFYYDKPYNGDMYCHTKTKALSMIELTN